VAHCIFCKRTLTKVNRSKEHVFPVWLLEEMGARDRPIRPSEIAPSGREVILQRDLTYDGFQAGRVCGVCNKGWMSRLEDDIKPILTSLIRGKRSLKRLDSGAQALLAKWAAKTSYALSSTTQSFNIRMPSGHPASLVKPPHLPAPEVSVFAFQYESDDPIHAERPTWLASASTFRYEIDGEHAPDQEVHRLHHFSYKVCLGLNRLMLLVAAWPRPWVQVYWEEIHMPLCRRSNLALYSRVPNEFPTDRSLARLAFHASLAVAHEEVTRHTTTLPAPPPMWLTLAPELWAR